jgi:hypothetical protein
MTRASGEIGVRLEAKLARVTYSAENQLLRQVNGHGQRRLIIRSEVRFRESGQFAPVH